VRRHVILEVIVVAIAWEWWLVGSGHEEWDNLREVACMGRYMMGCYSCSSPFEHYHWDWKKRNW